MRIDIKAEDISIYTGGKHVPPAPRLDFGDWVSWRDHHGKRQQGMFVKRDETSGLAIVRQSIYLHAHVRPNRLTVH